MQFKHLADAFVASRNWDAASLSRLAYWVDVFGPREAESITTDEIDAALVRLAQRGRLLSGRRATTASGQPLKGATLNRYVGTLGSVYKFARRARLLPRQHVAPTRGIERLPEPVDPDRYLRVEEAERILACARVVDRRWRRLPALIVLALHTGLRKGNLQALRWEQVDLAARRLVLGRTKNGEPIGCALTARCVEELEKLTGKEPQALVFGNRSGQPFHFGGLWRRACALANLPGRNFHQLRHGCGSALAAAGVSQAQIMAVMGHKTLTASRRYMHHNIADQRDVVDRVFGA
jgi:integrase